MSESIDFFWSLFIFNIARLAIRIYLGSTIIRLFISQILTVLSPLGEKFNFSVRWDLNQKVYSAIKPPQPELQNSTQMKRF